MVAQRVGRRTCNRREVVGSTLGQALLRKNLNNNNNNNNNNINNNKRQLIGRRKMSMKSQRCLN